MSAYCSGTIPLEDVWKTLDKAHQLELVDSVVHAMEELQPLDVSSICQSLPGIPLDQARSVQRPIGGPILGYFSDVKQFLDGILQASKQTSPTCTLLDLPDGGISLESVYDDIGRVELTYSNLDDLQHHAVFCHNDLEPRNILVKKVLSTPEEGVRYEVASLIDWEMAGFYPFAYESGRKDTILGIANLSFSWYTLFKERTSHLLPRDEVTRNS